MTYYSAPDLARAFKTVRKNTITVATDIPAEHYGHRATPDTRSVLETLAHVAAQTRWVHQLHGMDRKTFVSFEDFMSYIQAANAFAAGLDSKDAVLAALEAEGQKFGDWLAGLSQDDLAQPISFPPPIDPPSKSRFEMLLGAKEHEMHHRAQLMVLQRQLGIVPHLTRARQAR